MAIIPARGGSKGILRKNLALVGGQTLVGRAVHAARRSTRIDRIVVSTDDDDIAQEALLCGAEVVIRPADLATDATPSEAALLHAIDAVAADADIIAFLQCTSPFVDVAALDRAVLSVESGACDVAFSAMPSHRFLWRRASMGSPHHIGVNHDHQVRERRQDRAPEYCETGAFYVVDRVGFVAAGHRFFGVVTPVVVDAASVIEIDDEDDLRMARVLASVADGDTDRTCIHLDFLDRPVDAVVTDFDGVHTDNLAMIDEHGRESVVVNRSDGLGIAALRRAGVDVLVLSTEQNEVVRRRANKLGVECVHGCDDKLPVLAAWLRERGHRPDRTVYVGNDVNDAACLSYVGLPIVVADAHPDVRVPGRLRTAASGGAGAVREVADLVLRSSHLAAVDPADSVHSNLFSHKETTHVPVI